MSKDLDNIIDRFYEYLDQDISIEELKQLVKLDSANHEESIKTIIKDIKLFMHYYREFCKINGKTYNNLEMLKIHCIINYDSSCNLLSISDIDELTDDEKKYIAPWAI